jgi:hypothetical protein
VTCWGLKVEIFDGASLRRLHALENVGDTPCVALDSYVDRSGETRLLVANWAIGGGVKVLRVADPETGAQLWSDRHPFHSYVRSVTGFGDCMVVGGQDVQCMVFDWKRDGVKHQCLGRLAHPVHTVKVFQDPETSQTRIVSVRLDPCCLGIRCLLKGITRCSLMDYTTHHSLLLHWQAMYSGMAVWDGETGTLLWFMECESRGGPHQVLPFLATRDDGSLRALLLTSFRRDIRVWDALTGEKLSTFEAPNAEGPFSELIIAPGGGYQVVAACNEGKILVWDLGFSAPQDQVPPCYRKAELRAANKLG